jgi:hypothetical protein
LALTGRLDFSFESFTGILIFIFDGVIVASRPIYGPVLAEYYLVGELLYSLPKSVPKLYTAKAS